MPLLKIGNHVVNTGHVMLVELHFERAAFDPPDLEQTEMEASASGEQKQYVLADLVRIHFHGATAPMVFYHDEAVALRKYFSDERNVQHIDKQQEQAGIGFGFATEVAAIEESGEA